MLDAKEIEKAVAKAIAEYKTDGIRIGVSQRHIHLSQEDLEKLFGKGYELTKKKSLMGREYAAEETVTLVGPSRPRAVVALGKVAYAHRCEPRAGRRAVWALRGARRTRPAAGRLRAPMRTRGSGLPVVIRCHTPRIPSTLPC